MSTSIFSLSEKLHVSIQIPQMIAIGLGLDVAPSQAEVT